MKLFGIEIAKASDIQKIREDLLDVQRQYEDIGWVKINSGGYGDSYTLVKDHFDRMVQRSRLAFIKNPIVAQAIYLTTWYTFGDGLPIPKATDPEVQNIINDFWNHPDNKLSLTDESNQLKLSNKIQFDGELALAMQVDTDGTLYVRIIDPLSIVQIFMDPEDNMRPLFYKRVTASSNKKFIPDWHNGLAYMKDKYPAEWAAMLKKFDIQPNEVLENTYLFHVKQNNDILDSRGIPDVYRALDWMNSNSKINSDCATFINSQSQFAWNRKISGTKNQINSMVASQSQNTSLTNPAKMAGSTYVHNDKVEMTPVGLPGSTGGVFETGIRRTLLMMCAAFGIMEHYFGDPSTGNLATSKSMELPMLKKFLARRKMWSGIYKSILNYQLDMKLWVMNRNAFQYMPMKNRLMVRKGRDYADRSIDVKFPPILEKDIKMMVAAMSEAKAERLVPIETAQREVMGAMGIHDIDAELQKEFETAPEPPPTGGGGMGSGGLLGESIRKKGKSVQAGRAEALKLADKNKSMLRQLSSYKNQIGSAYTGLISGLKESAQLHKTPSERYKLSIPAASIKSHLKTFEKKMMSAADHHFPQAVGIAEAYVKGKLKKGMRESRLIEANMDAFAETAMKKNASYVKTSLVPALKEKFDSTDNADYADETAAYAAFDDLAMSQESRVGSYVGALWSAGEKAVVDAAEGSGLMANFAGVDDQGTCQGCGDAMDGNPWPVDEVPIPGEQDCIGNCRHAVQLEDGSGEDDSLSESDVQNLRDAEAEAKRGYQLLPRTSSENK